MDALLWAKWNKFCMLGTSHYQPELPIGRVPRSRYTLGEVERLIRKFRIIVPCPSRQTLIRMCEDGTLDASRLPGRQAWYVYADSFWSWAGCDEQ